MPTALIKGARSRYKPSIHSFESSLSPVQLASFSGANTLLPSPKSLLCRAAEFGLPYLDLTCFNINQIPSNLVAPKLVRQHRVLPLQRRNSRLYLAVADPTNTSALNDITVHTGLKVELVLVATKQLESEIVNFLEQQSRQQESDPNWGSEALKNLAQEIAATKKSELHSDSIDEAPIVSLVNQLLADALQKRASDIHIEPYEKIYRIRYRLDGILRVIATPPISLAGRIASRIKVMAHLDISEKRQPQDGRIKSGGLAHTSIDCRVSVLPTLWGEKIVLRLQDPSSLKIGIESLGLESNQRTLFLNTLRRQHGLILVTGPTGSGKSVSLYTGLTILNDSEHNIATAEDPVEMNIDGVNQVSINTRSGFGFAEALRAFLRQDPDIIMIGEIRDPETVDMAIKAAQTGHLVLSTLHTNSAIETITRLRNMGVSAFNLATSVRLIVAQRLARRLCESCKERLEISEKTLKEEGFPIPSSSQPQLYKAVGCSRCHEGYRGRIGIYEVVPITNTLSRLIMEGASSLQLDNQARTEGYSDLRTSALLRVAQGITSLDEVNRLR